MEKRCFGEGLMFAMQLYDRIESVKNEIGCLQKGFESAGNFEIENLRLRTTEKKIQEIDNYMKNMGSSDNYPMDFVARKSMWECLKKTEEEVKQLVTEIEKCRPAYEIYFCAYQASFSTFG